MARKQAECSAPTESDQEGGCINGNLVSSEQIYRMIVEAAYFRAEKRSLADGDTVKDLVWADRESQKSRLLRRMELFC